jgi:hypothetical protein
MPAGTFHLFNEATHIRLAQLLVSSFHEHLANPSLYFLLVPTTTTRFVGRNGRQGIIVLDIKLPSVTG